MSNFAISQTTSIPLTQTQVNNVYRGLVQGEYLKDRLYKSETALKSLQTVSEEQNRIIDKQNTAITTQAGMLKNLELQKQQEIEIREVEIKRLKEIAEVNAREARKQKRRSFWNGLGTGIVGTAVLGAVGILIIST